VTIPLAWLNVIAPVIALFRQPWLSVLIVGGTAFFGSIFLDVYLFHLRRNIFIKWLWMLAILVVACVIYFIPSLRWKSSLGSTLAIQSASPAIPKAPATLGTESTSPTATPALNVSDASDYETGHAATCAWVCKCASDSARTKNVNRSNQREQRDRNAIVQHPCRSPVLQKEGHLDSYRSRRGPDPSCADKWATA
jgi:hypothetical protein